MKKSLTAEKKILAARSALLWDHPFFGTLAIQLELAERDDIPTMATDGTRLYWNRSFVDGLKLDELIFVLAHEVLHNAFDHHVRKQGREHKRWNIAADYAINGELTECKVGQMPKIGLLDPQYTGLSAEEIYAKLPEGVGGGGAQPGADPGGCGAVLPAADAHDEAALKQASADMKVKVRQAAAIAKKMQAGNLPGSLADLIGKLVAPVVDWRALLRRFIDDSACRDYSWMRPNRRFLSQGLILPSLISDGLNHLVVAVDTSGSIDVETLTRFASEIDGAFGDGSIDKVTVIYADTDVQHVEIFECGDELVFNAKGRGGTAFSNTFRWIERNAADASAIVYFTDLYVADFGEEPATPVLWAVQGDSNAFAKLAHTPPFGEAVSLAL